MHSVQQTQSFVEWAFGPTFAESLAASFPADLEPRPTASFAANPSAIDDAFRAGFYLGLDREEAAAPPHFTRREALHFRAGWAAGNREWERRLDEMYAEAVADGRVTDADVYPKGVC
jgi:hypothetical protein